MINFPINQLNVIGGFMVISTKHSVVKKHNRNSFFRKIIMITAIINTVWVFFMVEFFVQR